jgi:hypothetical protein
LKTNAASINGRMVQTAVYTSNEYSYSANKFKAILET